MDLPFKAVVELISIKSTANIGDIQIPLIASQYICHSKCNFVFIAFNEKLSI